MADEYELVEYAGVGQRQGDALAAPLLPSLASRSCDFGTEYTLDVKTGLIAIRANSDLRFEIGSETGLGVDATGGGAISEKVAVADGLRWYALTPGTHIVLAAAAS